MAIAAVTACVFAIAVSVLRPWLVQTTKDVDEWKTLLCAVALLIVVGSSTRQRLSIAGIRNAWCYPPLWFGVSFGLAGALEAGQHHLLSGAELKTDSLPWLAPTVASLIAAPLLSVSISIARRPVDRAIAWIRRIWPSPPLSAEERGEGWAGISETTRMRDQEELAAWIKGDVAVSEGEPDFFGAEPIAQRMAERIISREHSAQALIGALGAGKTSVMNLVAAKLGHAKRLGRSNVVLVPVALWPYETTSAAVQGVISAVARALSREVDSLRISGIPEKYVTLISTVSGRLSTLVRLLRAADTPTAVLNLVDDIAISIGVRYVVWVEDLERFAPAEADVPARDLAETERLAPLRSLLHGLDQLQNVSVVTSTTSLFARFDLEKIARYVEKVPALDGDQVRRIIDLLREHWARPFDFVETSGADRRDLGWKQTLSTREQREFGVSDAVDTVAHAVVILAKTPRRLKQILRAVDDRWSALRGEINFDDLLAASAIREAEPAAFALLEQVFDRLRYPLLIKDSKRPEYTVEHFERDLRSVVADSRHRRAIAVIVEAIVTDAPPQGLASRGYADYWMRFLSSTVIESKLDQYFLRLLTAGRSIGDENKFDPAAIVNALNLTEGGGRAFVYFSFLLAGEQLTQILAALVEFHLNDEYRHWSVELPPSGLDHIWRAFALPRRNDLDERALSAAIIDLIIKCVPTNLPLALELERWFLTAAPGESRVIGAVDSKALSERFREFAVYELVDSPDRLSRSVRNADERLLHWFLYGFSGSRRVPTPAAPLQEWPKFRETLLYAAIEDPKAVLPLLAYLVTSSTRLPAEDTVVFDSDTAEVLFGDARLLLSVFDGAPKHYDSERVTVVRRAARSARELDAARSALVNRLAARATSGSPGPAG